MALVARRPGDISQVETATIMHTSWFSGAEATPIGNRQRRAFVEGRRRSRVPFIQAVALAIAGTTVIMAVLRVSGVAFVPSLLAGVALTVIAPAIVKGFPLKARRQHARRGRVARRLLGGGAHL